MWFFIPVEGTKRFVKSLWSQDITIVWKKEMQHCLDDEQMCFAYYHMVNEFETKQTDCLYDHK